MKTRTVWLICLFVISAQAMAFASGGSDAVNEKLIRAFRDAFPLAEKVDWRERGNNYVVYFREKEVLSEIEYDPEGNFMGSYRYYKDVNRLPIRLAWELHKKYSGKSVFGITETNSDSGTLYYVKMEDNKEWITVIGSSEGILEVTDKLRKL
jgi:hypothetical protein